MDLYKDHTPVPTDPLSQADLVLVLNHVSIGNTKGWKICVEWADETSSCHPMSELKNSFPMKLAEYTVANDLQDQSAF